MTRDQPCTTACSWARSAKYPCIQSEVSRQPWVSSLPSPDSVLDNLQPSGGGRLMSAHGVL